MKKTILLPSLFVVFTMFSCSKNDSPSVKSDPITVAKIQGKWYIKSTIKENGTIDNYQNPFCSTLRDYIEITAELKIVSAISIPSCIVSDSEGCAAFTLNTETKKIQNCNDLFNGTIVKLSDTEIQIDYDGVKFNSNPDIGVTKGIVLSRN